jgi:hypothetical protein
VQPPEANKPHILVDHIALPDGLGLFVSPTEKIVIVISVHNAEVVQFIELIRLIRMNADDNDCTDFNGVDPRGCYPRATCSSAGDSLLPFNHVAPSCVLEQSSN